MKPRTDTKLDFTANRRAVNPEKSGKSSSRQTKTHSEKHYSSEKGNGDVYGAASLHPQERVGARSDILLKRGAATLDLRTGGLVNQV